MKSGPMYDRFTQPEIFLNTKPLFYVAALTLMRASGFSIYSIFASQLIKHGESKNWIGADELFFK